MLRRLAAPIQWTGFRMLYLFWIGQINRIQAHAAFNKPQT